MTHFSDRQSAALAEIFQVGIERAAAALTKLVAEPVGLTVPSIAFLPVHDLPERLFGPGGKRSCGVIQHFDGPFRMDAILLFPGDRSIDVVRMMMDDACTEAELPELEAEAMAEIGNILLYACVGSVGNLTRSPFKATLPEVRFGSGDELLGLEDKPPEETALFVYIDFTIASRTITGYLVFLMEPPALASLTAQVDRFIEGRAG